MKQGDTIVIMPNAIENRKMYTWAKINVSNIIYKCFTIQNMDDEFVSILHNNQLIIIPKTCIITIKEFRHIKLKEILL